MSRLSLALVAIVGIVFATFTPSLSVAARAQNATRFEYVRLAPYTMTIPTSANAVQERQSYRACFAAANEWRCRDFLATESSAEALRTALATLGNEGWELVSAVRLDPSYDGIAGLTYLFKRQAR